MYFIAFDIREIHGFGNKLSHCAFATACWTGEEPEVMVRGLWLVVFIGLAVRQ
jgi:hypothetical protein